MRRLIVFLVAAALVAGAALPVGAQEAPDRRFEEVSIAGIDTELLPALADPNRMVTVMVEMEGAPVAVEQGKPIAQGSQLSKAQRAALPRQLEGQQDAIAPSIRRLGGVVQSQLQDAYNGMRVRIAASKVGELAGPRPTSRRSGTSSGTRPPTPIRSPSSRSLPSGRTSGLTGEGDHDRRHRHRDRLLPRQLRRIGRPGRLRGRRPDGDRAGHLPHRQGGGRLSTSSATNTTPTATTRR